MAGGGKGWGWGMICGVSHAGDPWRESRRGFGGAAPGAPGARSRAGPHRALAGGQQQGCIGTGPTPEVGTSAGLLVR